MVKPGAAAMLSIALASVGGSLPAAAAEPATNRNAAARDGQKDFDWEIGTWATSVKVRRNPLSGTTADWAEYRGTSVVKPLLDGHANFVELSVVGPRGKIEGGSLRLYTQVSSHEAHFEQAYSKDGGQSWEDNWIAVDTRH